SFSHLVIGYESRYYSYLWAESYSADMYYSRFYRDGVDNKQTGMEYRKEILQPGGARDSITSMEQFLGRKPNNDAYLKSMGL
ncbi:Thimet oligopeptidase, partial [Coemansia sp. RSA 2618]